MTDKTIGIIGLGSIGLRHVTELIDLGVTKFYALRTNKGSKDIPKEIAKYVDNIYSINDFLNLDIDAFIISNPTSMHINSLNLVLPKNKPIFIEKPLCNSLNEIRKIESKNLESIQIGFCLRFHELTKRIKDVLTSGMLGNIYHSRLMVGQYLPSWHPYTDYRLEYFSKKELGGGAIRTLSHEIDLAFYFFGEPKSSKVHQYKLSNLEIDVDDYSMLLLQYDNQLVRIDVDFLNKKIERKGVVFGTKADLHYDFIKNEIEIYSEKGLLIKKETLKAENMYSRQMLAFLNLVETNQLSNFISTFGESVKIIKIIENE